MVESEGESNLLMEKDKFAPALRSPKKTSLHALNFTGKFPQNIHLNHAK